MEHFNFVDRFSWFKFKISWLVRRKNLTDNFYCFKSKYNLIPKRIPKQEKHNTQYAN